MPRTSCHAQNSVTIPQQRVRDAADARQIDPFDIRVVAVAVRTEDDGGDARRGQERRVHPASGSDQRRFAAAAPRQVSPRHGDDRLVRRDGERFAHEQGALLGAKGGIARAGAFQDPRDLPFDLRRRLTGDRSPLDGEQTAIWVGGELLTAPDQRGMDRGRTQQRVAWT